MDLIRSLSCRLSVIVSPAFQSYSSSNPTVSTSLKTSFTIRSMTLTSSSYRIFNICLRGVDSTLDGRSKFWAKLTTNLCLLSLSEQWISLTLFLLVATSLILLYWYPTQLYTPLVEHLSAVSQSSILSRSSSWVLQSSITVQVFMTYDSSHLFFRWYYVVTFIYHSSFLVPFHTGLVLHFTLHFDTRLSESYSLIRLVFEMMMMMSLRVVYFLYLLRICHESYPFSCIFLWGTLVRSVHMCDRSWNSASNSYWLMIHVTQLVTLLVVVRVLTTIRHYVSSNSCLRSVSLFGLRPSVNTLFNNILFNSVLLLIRLSCPVVN